MDCVNNVSLLNKIKSCPILCIMKFYETHFEDYIVSNKKTNLHPKLNKIVDKFPKIVNDIGNIIFYGPEGVGKYTQMLKSIKRYSPSELKYEKKIIIMFNKRQYFFKISDIHYEIDMSLLGCNSRLLWHDIYMQLIDIISTKPYKTGIIVCKYFHTIHNELLDNFYSYMQENNSQCVKLKFFILTEEISFIPDNILNYCEIITVARPSKSSYNKCFKLKLDKNAQLNKITNMKDLNSVQETQIKSYEFICGKLINIIINVQDIKFLKFRDCIYEIFIYNLYVTDCVWFILSYLIRQKHINDIDVSRVMVKTYSFFHYYNNNYRPIYHLEGYLFFLISVIHNFNT